MTYLGLDDRLGELAHGIGQPAFQTLGKIADGLRQRACEEGGRSVRATPGSPLKRAGEPLKVKKV